MKISDGEDAAAEIYGELSEEEKKKLSSDVAKLWKAVARMLSENGDGASDVLRKISEILKMSDANSEVKS